MLTYTISVSTHSTLLRYSLVLSEYLSNHSTCPDTRPDTINTRPRRRPSVKLETYRPGNEANGKEDGSGRFDIELFIRRNNYGDNY